MQVSLSKSYVYESKIQVIFERQTNEIMSREFSTHSFQLFGSAAASDSVEKKKFYSRIQ